MTKLLEEAITEVQKLTEAEQDEIAVAMIRRAAAGVQRKGGGAVEDFEVRDEWGQLVEIDEETRAAISEGLAQARRGEFAKDEDIAALFERHGG